MISVHKVSKRFGTQSVLDQIDVEFHPGVITGLAGPNASGKTTLIKCILGLTIPDRGKIQVNGKPVDQKGLFRHDIGYMPQNPDFPPNLSLTELMDMLEVLRERKAAARDEVIVRFGLQKVLSQPFGTLSGGTKQKVAAATAFMFDAPVIILDEPTAGLDPLSSIAFKEYLVEKAGRGRTILLVSHFLSEIEQLAAHMVFLSDGRAKYSGPIQPLMQQSGCATLERALTGLFRA